MGVITAPLGEIANVVRGVTFSKADAIFQPSAGFLPVLRAGNIQDSLLLNEDLVYVPREKVDQKQLLRRDDIVICMSSGSSEVVGKTAIAEQDWEGSFGAFCAGIRANPKKCDPVYLFYYLRSPIFRAWTQNSSGANIKNIRKSELDLFEVPIPPLPEQRRIAAILDKADAIRRKREQLLAMTDNLLKSAFLEMFGDPALNPKGFRVERIGLHFSRERSGAQSGPFGSALKKHEYTDDGIPVWGVDNVQPNLFVSKAKLFISEDKYKQLYRYNVRYGDILISRAGTVGRMCIARPEVEHSIISTNLVRVVLNPQSLLAEYFVALFTYLPHRLGALKANNKDSAFTFLNPNTLKTLEIPIPPRSLQENYRQIVAKVESLTEHAEEHRNGLQELAGSLSQLAFGGEL